MDRETLVLAVHLLAALGLVGVGAVRVTAGNAAGGAVSVGMAVAVAALGFFIARRQ